MAKAEVELTVCPLCSTFYEAEGCYTPILLPCEDIVCRQCLRKKLLRDGSSEIDCPKCGLCLMVKNPDDLKPDAYIKGYIKGMQIKGTIEHYEECDDHKKQENMYCNDCQVPICYLCLQGDHVDHDINDLNEVKEQQFTKLMGRVGTLKKKLESNREKLQKAIKDENKNCQSCIKKIGSTRKALVKRLKEQVDKLCTKVNNEKVKCNSQVEAALGSIDDSLKMLVSIEETTDEDTTHKGILKRLETLESIKTDMEVVQSDMRNFKHVSYNECRVPKKTIRKLCGEVESAQNSIKLARMRKKVKRQKEPEEDVCPNEVAESRAIVYEDQEKEPNKAIFQNEKVNSTSATEAIVRETVTVKESEKIESATLGNAGVDSPTEESWMTVETLVASRSENPCDTDRVMLVGGVELKREEDEEPPQRKKSRWDVVPGSPAEVEIKPYDS